MKENTEAIKLHAELSAQARTLGHICNALYWGRIQNAEADFMADLAHDSLALAVGKLDDVTDTEARALLQRMIDQTRELLQKGGKP